MTTILRGCVGAITSAAVIRALQDQDVRVVGMDSDARSVGFDLCDASYKVQQPDHDGYIDTILSICKGESVDAILPSAEEEVLRLTAAAHRFEDRGIRLIAPSAKTALICADKARTYRYFINHHIPMPALYGPHPANFPCIVKPRMGRGGKGVVVVQDQAELSMRQARDPWLLVQEYIEGPVWAVDVLADWDSTVLSMVSRKSYLMQSGSTTKGITWADPVAVTYVQRMVKDLRLVGPTIIQYLLDDSAPKFIDINTRFGGGVALSMAADPSIIPNLVKMVRGVPTIPSKGFTEGVVMLRHYTETFSYPGE